MSVRLHAGISSPTTLAVSSGDVTAFAAHLIPLLGLGQALQGLLALLCALQAKRSRPA